MNEVQKAAYNVIGQLAIVCPKTVNQNFQLVDSFFEQLSQAPVELHATIREALVALAQALVGEAELPNGENEHVKTANGKFVPNPIQIRLMGMLSEKVESKLTVVQNVTSAQEIQEETPAGWVEYSFNLFVPDVKLRETNWN